MRRRVQVILLLLAWLLALPIVGFAQSRAQHSKWLNLPTQELMDMADMDFANGGAKDTALMCYTIVANRYETSMPRDQQVHCKNANMRLWSIYFYDYYDYSKCFDCLTRSLDIANSAQVEDANIYLGFGCMYQTISEECNDYDLGTKALEYYQQALTVGLRTHDDEHTDMASTDVLAMAHAQGGLSQIEATWQQYLQQPEEGTMSILRRYNEMLYQAFSHVEQGRLDAALSVYDNQLRLIDTTQYTRLVYFTHIEKAKVHALRDDYRNAIAAVRQAEDIATRLEMKDCKLEVYGLLSQYFQQVGDHVTHDQYFNRYVMLKDTLTNYRQLASVNEMEFNNELKGMEQEMNEIKLHREVMSIVTLVSLAFLLALLVMLYLVYRKNRELTRSNLSLYQKNVEMLRAEEEERRMRRQLQEQETLAAEQDSIKDTDVKYKSSHLSEDDKRQLLARILQVMENNPEIFTPDFSLERLAMLSQSRYKYVSQVINEHYGQNFNNFLNSYRIKEACKRMGDIEHYGNYTIEAISESVGFKSRSTFVTSFKRITGLTPSQYQQLARDESRQ